TCHMGFHVINLEAESTTHNNTPLLGFVIFFSLRHQKLSSPTKSMEFRVRTLLLHCSSAVAQVSDAMASSWEWICSTGFKDCYVLKLAFIII
ncbi:hypothetical protein HID58_048744, partial [Brassica napus]